MRELDSFDADIVTAKLDQEFNGTFGADFTTLPGWVADFIVESRFNVNYLLLALIGPDWTNW
jgi:hypothetical protein